MWVFFENTVVKYSPLRIWSQRTNWSAFASVWMAAWNIDPGLDAASTTRTIRSTRGRVSIPSSFPWQSTTTSQSFQFSLSIHARSYLNQNATLSKTSKKIVNVVLEKRWFYWIGFVVLKGEWKEKKKNPTMSGFVKEKINCNFFMNRQNYTQMLKFVKSFTKNQQRQSCKESKTESGVGNNNQPRSRIKFKQQKNLKTRNQSRIP